MFCYVYVQVPAEAEDISDPCVVVCICLIWVLAVEC